MVESFRLTREELDHLSPLHRLAAEAAIKNGRGQIVEKQENDSNTN